MARNWVRALDCKFAAVSDAVGPEPICSHSKKKKKKKKAKSLRLLAAACSSSSGAVNDAVSAVPDRSSPLKIPSNKSEPASRPSLPVSTAVAVGPELAEMPLGHPSRRVVELIFRLSWAPPPFAGDIEAVFRVRNTRAALARFEAHRSAVRRGTSGGRCAVDGNEMMQFHPVPSLSASGGDVYVAAADWGKAGVGTGPFYSGSGGAHESAGGGGTGRRGTLLCRVIAGRVRTGSQSESEGGTGFDSASAGMGELVVFDPRAVLPCFLIIYRI